MDCLNLQLQIQQNEPENDSLLNLLALVTDCSQPFLVISYRSRSTQYYATLAQCFKLMFISILKIYVAGSVIRNKNNT